MFKNCEKNTRYKVNESGDVIGPSGRVLKGFIHPKGYKHVFLGKGDCSKVHRLVAQAFIPNPENKKEVNHIDGNKLNNNVYNLEWVTHKENMRHARVNNLLVLPSGENSRRAILKKSQVEEIRARHVSRDKTNGLTALAKEFNVSVSCIHLIIKNKNWNNATW